MSEKTPQPETRNIVGQPLDVVGRLLEEKMTREWVDIEDKQSVDDFQAYLNRDTAEKAKSDDEVVVGPDSGIFSDDVFYDNKTESVYSIGGKRTVGTDEVYLVTAEYRDHDGRHKKAIMELDEEKAKKYLAERGATLLEAGHDRTIADEQLLYKLPATEANTAEYDAASTSTSETILNPSQLKTVFERTYTVTAQDVKNLIDTSKETAQSSEPSTPEPTPSKVIPTSDTGERRINGVTQNPDEIRAMAEVATARQLSNAEHLIRLQERFENADTKSEEGTTVPESSADRLAKLQAKLTETSQETTSSQTAASNVSEQTPKKRNARNLFSNVKNKIFGIFKRRSNEPAGTLSHEDQLTRDNAANWSTVAQAEAASGKLFTSSISERKSKQPNVVKEKLRKFGKNIRRIGGWNSGSLYMAPTSSNVTNLNTRSKRPSQTNNDRRAA